MSRKPAPIAICYDFDGTLAPGNMQERDFIPSIGMTTSAFWAEVRERCQKHEADNILMYMGLMLEKANAARLSVKKTDFRDYGAKIEFFKGVEDWFPRISTYGNESGCDVSHHIISSGIREMIEGTPIARNFTNIYASSFFYNHHEIATWPALALNYTTKTQYLFRINKGVKHVYDHTKINDYVAPSDRPVPFSNMVFIGDGETDIPCFRLVKDKGGHSIAVFKPHTKGAKSKAQRLLEDGRVDFVVPADYSDSAKIDKVVKSIIDKISADAHLGSLRGS